MNPSRQTNLMVVSFGIARGRLRVIYLQPHLGIRPYVPCLSYVSSPYHSLQVKIWKCLKENWHAVNTLKLSQPATALAFAPEENGQRFGFYHDAGKFYILTLIGVDYWLSDLKSERLPSILAHLRPQKHGTSVKLSARGMFII